MANGGTGGIGGGSSGAGGFAGRTSFGGELVGGQPGGGPSQLPTIVSPEEEEEERARIPIANANAQAFQQRKIDEVLGQPEGTPFAADVPAPEAAPVTPPTFGPSKLLTTGSTTSTQRVMPTAAEKGLLTEAATLGQQQVAQTQQLAEARVGQREGEAQRAEIEAEQRAAQAEEQQQIVDRGRQLITRRESEAKEAAEAAANFKIGQFFDDKPTSQRVITGLAIALGEIGRGLTGGQRNVAFEIFQGNVQQFQRQQEQKLAQLGQRAATAERGVDRASAQSADDLRTLQIKQAGFWKKVEADARASLARQGMDAAAIEDNLVVTRAAQASNERLRAAEAPFRRQVSTSVQKQLVGGGGTAPGGAPLGLSPEKFRALQSAILANPQGEVLNKASQKVSNFQAMRDELAEGIRTNNQRTVQDSLRFIGQLVNGGVLSDGEAKAILGPTGGVLERAGERVNVFFKGTPSQSQLKGWLGAIDSTIKSSAKQEQVARQRLGQTFGVDTINAVFAPAPGAAAQPQAAAGGAPATQQGPAGLSREVVQQTIALIKADPTSDRAKRASERMKRMGIPF